MLAYLAIEADRPHPREQLAALFWPEHSQSAAYANLRQTLSRLRKALPTEADPSTFLTVTPQTIQFRSDLAGVGVDVWRFDALVEAATAHQQTHQSVHGARTTCTDCMTRLAEAGELYRGELLAELHVDGEGRSFEEWLVVRREAARRAAVSGLQALVQQHKTADDHEQVRRWAMRLVAVDPWNEDAYRSAMRAFALTGDRTSALAQYEACRRVLGDDLGVEPGVETTVLFERIRDGALVPEATPAVDSRPVTPPTNLRADLTPFVGREADLASLTTLQVDGKARLLTLSGVGGMGKTRLALELARRQLGRFADGVFLVALAPLTSSDDMVPAIASAIGVTINAGDPHYGGDARNALLTALRDKHLLLVLDNMEHLLAGGVDVVADLLAAAPSVALLVTSRERLNLHGEHHYVVRGLPYASNGGGPATVAPAVQLFVQAARRVQPGFALDDHHVADVLRICELVDGMPLGLELAAAWSEALSPREIASEIERSLDFLAVEWRDVPERQRSMRAVFDSSWRLLDDGERRAFRQLAVFRGGFTRAAAAEVGETTLAGLTTLVRKALLNRIGSGDGPETGRYEIHELLRQFAVEKLDTSPEERATIAARHAAFYLALADAATGKVVSSEQSEWLERIEREHDNIRAALAWTSGSADVELGLRLCTALWPFWQRRCHLAEGRRWFGDFLGRASATVDPDVLASAYVGAAWLAHDQDDFERADELFESSLHIDRAIGTSARTAAVLAHRGVMARGQGRYGAAIALVGDSLALARSAGDEVGVAYALFRLGLVTREHGEYDRAAAAYDECLATYRRVGDRSGESFALLGLGDIARDRGEHERVVIHCEQSLAITRELGRQWGIAFALNNLALAAVMRGDLEEAAHVAGEALATFRAHGIRGGVLELLVTTGQISLAQGRRDEARATLRDAVVQGWPAGPLWLVVTGIEELGRVAGAAVGRQTVAVELCAAAAAWRSAMEAPLPPYRRPPIDALLADARIALGDEGFQRAWDEGSTWGLEQAVTVAREI